MQQLLITMLVEDSCYQLLKSVRLISSPQTQYATVTTPSPVGINLYPNSPPMAPASCLHFLVCFSYHLLSCFTCFVSNSNFIYDTSRKNSPLGIRTENLTNVQYVNSVWCVHRLRLRPIYVVVFQYNILHSLLHHTYRPLCLRHSENVHTLICCYRGSPHLPIRLDVSSAHDCKLIVNSSPY